MPRQQTSITRKEYIEDLAFQIREIHEDTADVYRQVGRLFDWQMEHKLMADEKAPEIVREALSELHRKAGELIQVTGSLERLMDWLDPPDRAAGSIRSTKRTGRS